MERRSATRLNRRAHGGPPVPRGADSRKLIAAALQTLQRMYRPGFDYVEAGVMLVDLQPDGYTLRCGARSSSRLCQPRPARIG